MALLHEELLVTVQVKDQGSLLQCSDRSWLLGRIRTREYEARGLDRRIGVSLSDGATLVVNRVHSLCLLYSKG